jgi:hypothetical protein
MRTLRALLVLAALSVAANGLNAQSTGAPILEQMTWDEVRDAIKAGTTTIIIRSAGPSRTVRTWYSANTTTS